MSNGECSKAAAGFIASVALSSTLALPAALFYTVVVLVNQGLSSTSFIAIAAALPAASLFTLFIFGANIYAEKISKHCGDNEDARIANELFMIALLMIAAALAIAIAAAVNVIANEPVGIENTAEVAGIAALTITFGWIILGFDAYIVLAYVLGFGDVLGDLLGNAWGRKKEQGGGA